MQWRLFAWNAEANSSDAIAEPLNETTGRGLSRTGEPQHATLRGQDYADLRTGLRTRNAWPVGIIRRSA